MKKSLYIAALAALSLTACSDDKYDVFDKSAAERLEDFKQEYSDVFTAGSGLWSVEYFSNPDEPGYVFVMKFDKNGSVEMSTNHKWAGGTFKQETSLWQMIADNGPVLSFSSYNTLFHIFADPADIPSDSNLNVGGDVGSNIDETGFGHEGDYEFQVMEVSDNGDTVRLMGKKYGHYIYMHKLDADTDIESFIADVVGATACFSDSFKEFIMTAEDGEPFRLSNLASGVVSIFPLDGDYVEQTVTGNGIFTKGGIRFMEPIQVQRKDGSTFELVELLFNEDNTMRGEGISDVRCVSPIENLARVDLTWYLDFELDQNLNPDFKGKARDMYIAAKDELLSVKGSKFNYDGWYIQYAQVNGVFTPQLVSLFGKKQKICFDNLKYVNLDYNENKFIIPSYDIDLEIISKDNTSLNMESQLPKYAAFKEYIMSSFTASVNNPMSPDVLTMTDRNDPTSSYVLKLGKSSDRDIQ